MKLINSAKKFFTDYSRVSPLLFTIVFVAVISQYSFHSLESSLFDFVQRLDITANFNDEIVIVTFDERSDEYLGERYPYSLATHLKTLENLIKEKPLAISLMTKMPSMIDRDAERFIEVSRAFQAEGGVFRIGSDFESAAQINPSSLLDNIGYSQNIVEADTYQFAKDSVVRRIALTRSGEFSLAFWLANEISLHKYKKPLTLKQVRGNFYDSIQDGDYAFFRYAKNPLPSASKVIQKVPYHLVANGTFPPNFFKNKVVLIGPSYVANSNDYAFTPFEKQKMITPKLAIIGSMIEALVERQTISILPGTLSAIIAAILGVILALSISKANPARGLAITGGIAVAILIINYGLLSLFSLWMPMVSILLTIAGAYYIGIPFKAIDEYQRRFEIQEETTLLRKVEKLKQNFISLMSHDLKTPVAKIAGIADTMRRQAGDNQELAKNINSIINSIHNRYKSSVK